MKKPTKSIITSSLLAIAFGALSVGTTFALFTSEASTAIDVQAGVIDLKAPVTVSSAWELGGTSMTGSGFAWTNSIGGSITKDDNNVIHLNKLAPGDGAFFALTPDNSGTNVKIKARLVVRLQGELAGALNVEVKAGENTVIAFNGAHTGYTPWQEVAVESNPTAFTVKVEFPDHDGGKILFGSANKDNQYQNKEATLLINYEAVQGNAQTDDVLQVINTKLMSEAYAHGANKTMHDALQDLSEAQVTAIQTKGYVWSVEEDQFYVSATPANAYKYFKMYDGMPDEQSYSIYAFGNGWTTVNGLTVGFDAGDTTGITSITYDRHEATVGQEVTIRTNTAQTSLTINAPLDTIHHYDALGALNIIEAATASYHEFGSIAFAEIAKGRIVLEEGSKVNEIHVNKKAEEQAFDTVIIANNGGNNELPSKITRDAVTVSVETLVVKVVSGQTSENVYVYANGTTGTTEKVTEGENKQNEAVNSALGQLVLDNGSAGEKAQTVEQKANEKAEAVEDAIDKESAENDVFILANGAAEETGIYKSLSEFRDAVNSGTTYAGYTVTLARNVNLKNAAWTPIGTKSNPFKGKFDGGNHVVRNLKINSTSGYAGLFGVVVGEQLNTPKLASDVWNDSNRSMKENSYSEDKFTAIIKNVTIDGFSFNSTSSNYHGTVAGFAVDAYFANLTVKNGTISTAGKAGGVIGSTTGSVVFDTLITENSVSVVATGHTAGGIIAGTNRNYIDNSEGVAFTVAEQNGSHVAIIINCINNATVSGNTHIGGIVGQPANTEGLQTVIFNCINNGNIYQNGPRTNEPTGGIAGSSTGVSFSAISNCVNNGSIISTSNNNCSFIGGIVGNGISTKIYNCINNGNITGRANKVAGIAAELSESYAEIDLESCSNSGAIINLNPNGQTYDVYGGNWSTQSFNASTSPASSVSDIQSKLDSVGGTQYNFVGYDAFEGTLTINKDRTYVEINADSRICSNVVIEGNRSQTIVLNIPNLVCTLSGDMSNVNLVIKGNNSSITISEGASLKNVYVSNAASFSNNGTIYKLQLTDIPTVTNGGTIGYLAFTVSENMTINFTNNGTITEQVRSSGQLHLIVSQGKGTVNFLNNGTINYDYENAPYNCSSYIFLSRLGDSVTLNINCTENSVIDGYQDMNWFCMYNSGNTFTVNYLEGAQFTVNGVIPSTYNYSRLAQNFHKVDSLD